jgi:DNA-binding NarL/FixJ family response regulator
MHVLIVDDQQFVRDTLRSLFREQQPRWELFEASNGHQAVELVRKATPEVVVLDIMNDGKQRLTTFDWSRRRQNDPAEREQVLDAVEELLLRPSASFKLSAGNLPPLRPR